MREGNNEMGDWTSKEWRHVDLETISNTTLASMLNVSQFWNFRTTQKLPKRVSLFVASDSAKTRPWFEEHAPKDWRVVKPGRELPRPESGVWFGEFGSKTSSNLTKNALDEAMAEAVADVFALGECDALYVPNYSSFNMVGIMLTRAERRKVYFLGEDGYIEYPTTTL
jgi:hypothetical protein